MADKIIIYGTGPLAELMHYHFSQGSDYEVGAFCLDEQYKKADQFCQLPVVTFETVTQHYPPDSYPMFVAIGYSVMRNREQMFKKAKAAGYRLVNYISPHATAREDLVMGENNAIFSSSDIEPFVTLGNNNVVWTGTIIGHHAVVGDHNYISGGGGVGGYCKVGNLCFIGNGAIMVNNINIADETLMVSGTVILKDTEVASRYHGNPSKLIGKHPDTGIVI
ncbi:MAG: acetyltransferase [Methylococcaceae bacterium]